MDIAQSPALEDRAAFCDPAQTFPNFIYLIPVVMLCGVNDVAAVGALSFLQQFR